MKEKMFNLLIIYWISENALESYLTFTTKNSIQLLIVKYGTMIYCNMN